MSTASTFFSQVGALFATEALQATLPVIQSTLSDIEANPAEWTNPATATVKGAAALANLTATLPTLEGEAVTGAAQIVSLLFTAVSNKVAALATSSVAASTGTAAVTATAAAAPSVNSQVSAIANTLVGLQAAPATAAGGHPSGPNQ